MADGVTHAPPSFGKVVHCDAIYCWAVMLSWICRFEVFAVVTDLKEGAVQKGECSSCVMKL